MDDFVARQLLQAVSRTATNATGLEVNSPNVRQYTNSRGFEFGIAVVMLMALGSCCLVTCCNCLRVGAAVMANYRSQQDRDADRNEARVANVTVQRERPRVVQHDWDPNNPDDPVFLVQPDGGVGLAYQVPGTPSAKSMQLESTPTHRRSSARGRLHALRACTCMAAPVRDESDIWDDNEAQRPEDSGMEVPVRESGERTRRMPPRRSNRRSNNARSTPEKTGRSKQDVEYCSICLDESVLAQSLADTTSVIEQSGGKTSSAQHTAVAMLLEKDESDDEMPVGKEGEAQSAVDVEKSKPGPEDSAN